MANDEGGRTKTAWFLAEVIFALLALVALVLGVDAVSGGLGVTVQITAEVNPDDVFSCEPHAWTVEQNPCPHNAEVVRLWAIEHARQEAP
jgi:hypothetical protein